MHAINYTYTICRTICVSVLELAKILSDYYNSNSSNREVGYVPMVRHIASDKTHELCEVARLYLTMIYGKY
jgi:hypothetical protein